MSDYAKAPALARAAPIGSGRIDFLINRPREGVHQPVDELHLDPELGILGDRWHATVWLRLPDGSPDPGLRLA